MKEKMNNEKLKPCPFCGGKTKVLGTKYEGGDYYIVCERCRVRVGSYSNPIEAIEAWNKRANSEKPKLTYADVEKMEKWINKAKTEIKYVAVDYSGIVCGYRQNPYLQKGSVWWHAKPDVVSECIYLGSIRNYKGDWKKSLRKVK